MRKSRTRFIKTGEKTRAPITQSIFEIKKAVPTMETASFPYLKPINNYYTFAKLLFGRSGRSLCFGSRSRRAYGFTGRIASRFTSRGAGRAKVATAGAYTLSLEITRRHIAVSPHMNRTTFVPAFEPLFQILYILVFG